MILDTLNESELSRYNRHFHLPQVGMEGQLKLKSARVLCVGAGALGSVVLPILASAGIGEIAIIDNDVIELSNLQRQTLYNSDDIGKFKAAVAHHKLSILNTDIVIKALQDKINVLNVLEYVRLYQYVVDCTDNLTTRYLLNAACVYYNIPYIYGGVFQFAGQCSVLATRNAPCYNCLFPEMPESNALPNCAEAGVLSSVSGIIGAIQANELLKLVLEINSGLRGRFLLFDALSMEPKVFAVSKNTHCRICASPDNIDINKAIPVPSEVSCGIVTAFINLSPQQAKDKLQSKEAELLDVRENHERSIEHIGGHHIPLSELEHSIDDIISIRKPLIIYCASGQRSLRAMHILKERNIACFNLEGGLKNWKLNS